MKTLVEELQQELYSLGASVYQQANAASEAADDSSTDSTNDGDDVIDAEFEPDFEPVSAEESLLKQPDHQLMS